MVYQLEPLPSAQPVKLPTAVTDQRGFTLPEVVVALLVCVVGLVGMASLLAVTLRMQQLGRNSTTAVRLAQEKVDELSAMNFGTGVQVQCGGSLTANTANYNDVPTINGQIAGYRRRWRVQAGPDADPQLRQVTIRLIPDVVERGVAAQYDLVTVIRGAGGAAC